MLPPLARSVLLLAIATLSARAEPEQKPKLDVPYVPTPQRIVDVMLQMAEVKKNDVLYDLGCGDGRLVILAAKRYGIRGVGIDIDPERIAEAKRNAAAIKVEHLVEFRQGDIFTSDFREATVLMLYLLDEVNVRLRPQIFAQLEPGARVVSHAFRMGEWEPDAERHLTISGWKYDIFLWVVPANASGKWKVTGPHRGDAFPNAIVIEQQFQMLTLRDEQSGQPIGDGRVTGTELLLRLNSAARQQPTTFNGSAEGDRISARATGRAQTWKAEREPGTAQPLE